MTTFICSIQAPQQYGGVTIPGYVQIDFIVNGENTRSTNPETMRREGWSVPEMSAWPQGRYPLELTRA